MTQPSVSAAVSALSRELGVELTERIGRSIRPSSAGQAFAPYAADVIGLLDQGRRTAQEAAEIATRELRIAAVTTAGEHFVPQLMDAFSASYPETTLCLEVDNRQRVFDRVRTHQSDLAIAGRPPKEGVVGEPFLDNPIVLITAPGDPLAGRRDPRVEELGRSHWLLREEGSGTRTMTEEFLASNQLHPRLLTLGSNGAIKQAVRAGLGISLQSLLAVQLELDLGLLATIDVRQPLPRREWYLLGPQHGPVRPQAQQFMAFVRSEHGRHALERAGRMQTAPGSEYAPNGRT